jgi:hypothetical protein
MDLKIENGIVEAELKPYQLIDLHINSHGIQPIWLAQMCDCSGSLICRVRSGDAPLSEKLREKINIVLDTNY